MFRLPVEVVSQYCDPFEGCWPDIDQPLTLGEITLCLRSGRQKLLKTESWSTFKAPTDIRDRHIRKIAYFVAGYQDPIQLDVGVPGLGHVVNYFVQDGNHRLASDLYRKRVFGEAPLVLVEVSGSIPYAKELGLWPRRSRRR